MLASLKAKLLAVKAYLVAHWKQLVAAVLAGHLGLVPAAVSVVKAGAAMGAHLLSHF